MGIIRIGSFEMEPTQWSVDLHRVVKAGAKAKEPGSEYRQTLGYFPGYAEAGQRLLEIMQNESDAADVRALIEATETAKREIAEAVRGVAA